MANIPTESARRSGTGPLGMPTVNSATVYRDLRNIHRLRLHQVSGEQPWSECLRGEALRRLELERIPSDPSRVTTACRPSALAQAAANRVVLERELDAHAVAPKAGW